MSQLTYLMREIGAGVEIFYSSKSNGQFIKSAFVLCDNYTELLSKLFLIDKNPNWLDMHGREVNEFETAKIRVNIAIQNGTNPTNEDLEKFVRGVEHGRFKNYHQVLDDVRNIFVSDGTIEVSILDILHAKMKNRRNLRNDFFHSAKLLQLSIDRSHCIEAFCDLLDYGEMLFRERWQDKISAGRTLGTLQILLQLEKKSFNNPSILPKIDKILKNCPQYLQFDSKNISATKKGIQITEYPADLHFILSVIGGGQELRDKLAALLP